LVDIGRNFLFHRLDSYDTSRQRKYRSVVHMIETDVIIIGGGLSGLAVADKLTRNERDWILLEARDRLGGRILSLPTAETVRRFDLGPAWLWPHNERMLATCERLGIRLFEQHAEGNLIFQDASGMVRRDLAFSTMAGALRIEGGIALLIERLAEMLPQERLRVMHRVVRLSRQGDSIEVEAMASGVPARFSANSVVLALPPRIVAKTIVFAPELPKDAAAALSSVPTWMASHAKAIAVYDEPFWRSQGFSGDAISHHGPMLEIHDASPCDGAVGALFGFIGTPVRERSGSEDEMRASVIAQLVELFGREAATPKMYFYTDWASEPETATTADYQLLSHHPTYGMPPSLSGLWDGCLVIAGTEVGEENGGFLEGALEAASAAIAILKSSDASP
jgi:monoamine oxidase